MLHSVNFGNRGEDSARTVEAAPWEAFSTRFMARSGEPSPASAQIKRALASLPPATVAALNTFFHKLLVTQQFGYGLLGVKPIAISSLVVDPNAGDVEAYDAKLPSLAEWTVWQHCQGRFTSSSCCLRFSHDPTKAHKKTLLLFNMTAARALLTGEIEIFRERLGRDTHPEDVLRRLENSSSLASAVDNHDVLVGLLLGFGRYNSLLVERRNMLRETQAEGRWLCRAEAIPSPGFDSAQAELDFLESTLRNTGVLPGQTQRMVPPITFMADLSHPETAALVHRYSRAQAQLEVLAQSERMLELALELYVFGVDQVFGEETRPINDLKR